ncbi:serine protease [Desulfococcaceae bacterium HSG8]|nr:serine protease [Desulfococcaceae bacterium HSG8]
MKPDLQDSIVLITSSDPGNPRFGTGFVIRQDNSASYILTCEHVIKDVTGSGQIMVEGKDAGTEASGAEKGIDLAVLRVEGLADKPVLNSSGSGETGMAFSTAGFQKYGEKKLSRTLQGKIGELVSLTPDGKERVKAWDLKITDEDFSLQPGYSGSPVADETGRVIGNAPEGHSYVAWDFNPKACSVG